VASVTPSHAVPQQTADSALQHQGTRTRVWGVGDGGGTARRAARSLHAPLSGRSYVGGPSRVASSGLNENPNCLSSPPVVSNLKLTAGCGTGWPMWPVLWHISL
jgi:hypothetical protein